jgi:argininosuccinate lyase
MRTAAGSSYAVSLDVAEQLVLQHNIPFREAHKIVGGLVSKAVSKRVALRGLEEKDIDQVLRSLKYRFEAKHVASIVKEMTPEKSVELRRSAGSPRKAEQEEMIKLVSQNVRNYKQGIQKRIKMVKGALQNLSREVQKYTES